MFREYKSNNQGCRLAAPIARDAKAPKPSMNNRATAPRYAEDYVYGYAVIKKSRKFKESNSYTINPMGWILPGGHWTRNNGVVMDIARRMDQYIIAGGGLPKGWLDKKEIAA